MTVTLASVHSVGVSTTAISMKLPVSSLASIVAPLPLMTTLAGATIGAETVYCVSAARVMVMLPTFLPVVAATMAAVRSPSIMSDAAISMSSAGTSTFQRGSPGIVAGSATPSPKTIVPLKSPAAASVKVTTPAMVF